MQPAELPTEKEGTLEQDSFVQSIMQLNRTKLKGGDRIRVLTLDGKRRPMKIVAIERDALSAKGFFSDAQEIPFDEIVFIEKDVKKGRNLWSIFPILEESTLSEKTPTCGGMVDELIRTDVLRRAINKEIVLLQWEFANTALRFQWHDQPRDHLERDKIARDAADARMIRLLQLCQENSCSNFPPDRGESTLKEVLEQIDSLKKELESGLLEEKEHEKELRKVLDSVI